MGANESVPLEKPSGVFKLTYLDAEPFAFAIRIALYASGINFIDDRIDTNEFDRRRGGSGPGNFSDEIPLGNLPTLTFPDGRVVCQSTAILRFVARFSSLYPTDAVNALTVDEVIDTVLDMNASIPKSEDRETLKSKREEWVKIVAPVYLKFLEHRLDESRGPFILGNDICIADLCVFRAVQLLFHNAYDFISPSILDNYPKILACHRETKNHRLVVSCGVY